VTGLGGLCFEQVFDVGERRRAVDVRFALAQEV
jgi:hypothetical protein